MSQVREWSGRLRQVKSLPVFAIRVYRAKPGVIIPTGYRDDYLRALKALSHQGATGPFVKMIDRAQHFVAELPFDDYQKTASLLRETGAMDESGDRRLRLPSELPQ